MATSFDERNSGWAQQQRSRERYQKKAAQAQLRRDLAGTPEDQRVNKLIWRWVLGVVLAIGGILYILPAWVLGALMLLVVGVVAMFAIAAGVKQGRGQ